MGKNSGVIYQDRDDESKCYLARNNEQTYQAFSVKRKVIVHKYVDASCHTLSDEKPVLKSLDKLLTKGFVD